MTHIDAVNTTFLAVAGLWLCVGVAIFPAKRQP